MMETTSIAMANQKKNYEGVYFFPHLVLYLNILSSVALLKNHSEMFENLIKKLRRSAFLSPFSAVTKYFVLRSTAQKPFRDIREPTIVAWSI